MPLTFDIDGLNAYINRLEERAPLAALQGAEVLAAGCREAVPVSANDAAGHVHLKATIAAKAGERDGGVGRAAVTAGEGLPDARAVFTEFGTVNAPAQHWFQRAIDEHHDAIVSEIAAILSTD